MPYTHELVIITKAGAFDIVMQFLFNISSVFHGQETEREYKILLKYINRILVEAVI